MSDYAGTVRVIDLSGNVLGMTSTGAVKVDGSAVTQQVSSGGTSTVSIPAGTATNTVVKASAGRLCRILVTSLAGAVAVNIYDNPTTGSGTIIGFIQASAIAGTILDFQMPAASGITVGGAITNPAMTVGFI